MGTTSMVWPFGKSKTDQKVDRLLEVATATLKETESVSKSLNDFIRENGDDLAIRVYIATGGNRRSKQTPTTNGDRRKTTRGKTGGR